MDKMSLHSAVSTKAMTMMGRLLHSGDYEELLKQSSFEGVISYLVKNTAYSDVLPAETRDIESFEKVLSDYLLDSIEKLYHYYNVTYKKYFRILFKRYEIENLKLVLRYIARKEDTDELAGHFIYPVFLKGIDYGRISGINDIGSLIVALRGTSYHDILRPFVGEDLSEMLFHMEMSLDKVYFRELKNISVSLESFDRKVHEELLGFNSDILNLQWIYRAKKFHDLSREEILNYSLESGLRYKYEELKKLAYMNLQDVEDFIRKSRYLELLSRGDVFTMLSMEKMMYKETDKLKKYGKNSIGTSLSYIHKLEFEIRDLFTIVEGIKYSQKDIGKYLIRDIG